jgi:signal transduction histidine kinase
VRRALGGAVGPSADKQLVDDVARIAEYVREVVDARAAMISRVLDDEWLEVMTVVGQPSSGSSTAPLARADLASLLANAEELGRLHATERRTLSYVEVPTDVPETSLYVGDHLGLLVAPLHAPDGELLGVLTTRGRSTSRIRRPHLRARRAVRRAGAARTDRAAPSGRPDRAAPAVVRRAGRAPGRRRRGGRAVAARVRGRQPGRDDARPRRVDLRGARARVHAEAASYPPEVAERLGADVCTLLQPMIGTCLTDETTLTDESAPLLGRLAAVTGTSRHCSPRSVTAPAPGRAAGAPSGRGRALERGDREALFALGRRLGTVADQVKGRRRDQEIVRELVRLDHYRRDLVASITHDLKTPLTAIALNTELLESDGRLAEAGSHPVAAIRRSADRLSNLVDDLLAMARAEEGADSLVEVDLVQMLRDACEHAETEARLRRVGFDLDTPKELWAEVDPNALARVFANLVGNAVKFSLPRGRVGLHLSRTDDAVEFRCSDEGIGIPPDRLETIFDISRRTPDARSEELPGSGIGLAICARIVTRLGGLITVDSTQGQGSTFTVRIPC